MPLGQRNTHINIHTQGDAQAKSTSVFAHASTLIPSPNRRMSLGGIGSGGGGGTGESKRPGGAPAAMPTTIPTTANVGAGGKPSLSVAASPQMPVQHPQPPPAPSNSGLAPFRALRSFLPFGGSKNASFSSPGGANAPNTPNNNPHTPSAVSRSSSFGFGSVRKSMTKERERERRGSLSSHPNAKVLAPVMAIERSKGDPQLDEGTNIRRSVSLSRLEVAALSSGYIDPEPSSSVAPMLRTPSPGLPLSLELSTIIEADTSGISLSKLSPFISPNPSASTSPSHFLPSRSPSTSQSDSALTRPNSPGLFPSTNGTGAGTNAPPDHAEGERRQLVEEAEDTEADTSGLDFSSSDLAKQVLEALNASEPTLGPGHAWLMADNAVVIDADAEGAVDGIEEDIVVARNKTHGQEQSLPSVDPALVALLSPNTLASRRASLASGSPSTSISNGSPASATSSVATTRGGNKKGPSFAFSMLPRLHNPSTTAGSPVPSPTTPRFSSSAGAGFGTPGTPPASSTSTPNASPLKSRFMPPSPSFSNASPYSSKGPPLQFSASAPLPLVSTPARPSRNADKDLGNDGPKTRHLSFLANPGQISSQTFTPVAFSSLSVASGARMMSEKEKGDAQQTDKGGAARGLRNVLHTRSPSLSPRLGQASASPHSPSASQSQHQVPRISLSVSSPPSPTRTFASVGMKSRGSLDSGRRPGWNTSSNSNANPSTGIGNKNAGAGLYETPRRPSLDFKRSLRGLDGSTSVNANGGVSSRRSSFEIRRGVASTSGGGGYLSVSTSGRDTGASPSPDRERFAPGSSMSSNGSAKLNGSVHGRGRVSPSPSSSTFPTTPANRHADEDAERNGQLITLEQGKRRLYRPSLDGATPRPSLDGASRDQLRTPGVLGRMRERLRTPSLSKGDRPLLARSAGERDWERQSEREVGWERDSRERSSPASRLVASLGDRTRKRSMSVQERSGELMSGLGLGGGSPSASGSRPGTSMSMGGGSVGGNAFGYTKRMLSRTGILGGREREREWEREREDEGRERERERRETRLGRDRSGSVGGGPGSGHGRFNSVRAASEYNPSNYPRAHSRMAFSETGGPTSNQQHTPSASGSVNSLLWNGRGSGSGSFSMYNNSPGGAMDSPTFTGSSVSAGRDGYGYGQMYTPRSSASTAATSISGYFGRERERERSERESVRGDRENGREKDRERERDLKERHANEMGALLSALSDSQQTARLLREENTDLRERLSNFERERERDRERHEGRTRELERENEELRRVVEELTREFEESERVNEELKRGILPRERAGLGRRMEVEDGTIHLPRSRSPRMGTLGSSALSSAPGGGGERWNNSTLKTPVSKQVNGYAHGMSVNGYGRTNDGRAERMSDGAGSPKSSKRGSLVSLHSDREREREWDDEASLASPNAPSTAPTSATVTLSPHHHARRPSSSSSIFPIPPSNMSMLINEDEFENSPSIMDYYRYPAHQPSLNSLGRTAMKTEAYASFAFDPTVDHDRDLSLARSARSGHAMADAGNISPTTANFSMTTTGSPGSLFLKPEHEMYLGEMESLDLGAEVDLEALKKQFELVRDADY